MANEPTNGELAIKLDNIHEKVDELKTNFKEFKETGNLVSKHDWQIKAAWWGLGALWVLLVIGFPAIWSFIKLQIKIIADESAKNAITQLEDKWDFKSPKE